MRAWLAAKRVEDGASRLVGESSVAEGDARESRCKLETALIAEAKLADNARSVRRVLVTSGSESDLVIVEHGGAYCLSMVVCPEEKGEPKRDAERGGR